MYYLPIEPAYILINFSFKLRDKMDHGDVLDKKEPEEVWEDLEVQDEKEVLDHKDVMEKAVLLDQKDPQDHQDHQDHQPQPFSHQSQETSNHQCTEMDTGKSQFLIS